MNTLAYYNGAAWVEKSLADWGICADYELEFRNKSRDAMRFRTIEETDVAAAQFAWGQPVIVYRDRAAAEGGGFSGGVVRLRGYVGNVRREANGPRQNLSYEIYGPWWMLERLQFRQSRKVFDHYTTPGDPRSDPVMKTVFFAEAFLGESAAEALYTGSQAVAEVLAYANEVWNPTKRGAGGGRDNAQDVLKTSAGAVDKNTSIPDWAAGVFDCDQTFPKTRAQSIGCAEAIVQVLRYFPTALGWFDYSTSPATFRLKDWKNLGAAIEVHITAEQEKELTLTPQYARQLDGVRIIHRKITTVNGVPWPAIWVDQYPAAITDWTPDVLEHVNELQGGSVTETQVNVSVLPLAAAFSGTGADRVNFWRAVDSSLQEPNIKPDSISISAPIKVFDSAGTDITATAGALNVLLPGTSTTPSGPLASWMGVTWKEATVQTRCSFERYRDGGDGGSGWTGNVLGQKVENRMMTHRVILTNAVSKLYQATTQSSSGDPVPPLYPAAGSLAYALYNSLKDLQWAGRVKFVGAQVRSDIAVGKVVTLIGPNNTYPNLLVQAVTERPHYGEMTVEFGPASRLDAQALIEMWLCTRWRTTYNMPSGRSSGQAAPSASMDNSGGTAKENTSHGLGDMSVFTVGAAVTGSAGTQTALLKHTGDPVSLIIGQQDSDGNWAATDENGAAIGRVTIALQDAGAKEIALRETNMCDTGTGAVKKARVLMSLPYV